MVGHANSQIPIWGFTTIESAEVSWSRASFVDESVMNNPEEGSVKNPAGN
jgi:hypothetical protein